MITIPINVNANENFHIGNVFTAICNKFKQNPVADKRPPKNIQCIDFIFKLLSQLNPFALTHNCGRTFQGQ